MMTQHDRKALMRRLNQLHKIICSPEPASVKGYGKRLDQEQEWFSLTKKHWVVIKQEGTK